MLPSVHARWFRVALALALAVLGAGPRPGPGGGADREPGRGAAEGRRLRSWPTTPARAGRPGTDGDRGGGRLHRRRLQGGRAQARPGRRRVLPAVHDRRRPRRSAATRRSTFNGPGGKAIDGRAQGRLHPAGDRHAAARSTACPVVFAGYGITAKDDAEEARLRRLRRPRRQGQGRPDHPPRAAAGQATTARSTASRTPTSPPSGTRRPTPSSTARRPSCWSTTSPASRAARTSCSASPTAGADVELDDPVPDGHPRLRRQAPRRRRASRRSRTLEKQIDADLKPRSPRARRAGRSTPGSRSSARRSTTKNVVGVLEGVGPAGRRDGRRRRPLRPPRPRRPALGLARVPLEGHPQRGRRQRLGHGDGASRWPAGWPARPDPLPRRVVFMAFSGEERGCSARSTTSSTRSIPLDDDGHDGQLRHGRPAQRQERADRLRHRHQPRARRAGRRPRQVGGLHGQEDRRRASGRATSESFYLKDIPVLFAFTGIHPTTTGRATTPSGSTSPGWPGSPTSASCSCSTSPAARAGPSSSRSPSPRGRRTAAATPAASRSRPTSASIPDYDDDVKGVKLDGVREGSPAEKGGLKGGDVIVGFGGKPVATIYDYTESLGRYKPGDTVEVVVKRDGKDDDPQGHARQEALGVIDGRPSDSRPTPWHVETAVRRLASGGLLGPRPRRRAAPATSGRRPGHRLAAGRRPSGASWTAEFRRWVAAHRPARSPAPVRIALGRPRRPATTPRGSSAADAAVDLVLGGPASDLRATGSPERRPRPDRRRRRPPGAWPGGRRSASRRERPASEPASGGPPTFDDPRHDPVALAWARARARRGGLGRGLRRARPRRRPRPPDRPAAGLGPGGRRARRGRTTPAVARRPVGTAAPLDPRPADGGRVGRRGRRGRRRAGIATGPASSSGSSPSAARPEPPPPIRPSRPEADGLLADLLGATLVDAQDELWAAWAALERRGHPASGRGAG